MVLVLASPIVQYQLASVTLSTVNLQQAESFGVHSFSK